MLQPRPYQQESVNAVYQHLRNRPDKNPCIVLPTGAGKSIVIAKIASDAVTLWSGRVLILAHVKELLEQNADKIAKLCPGIQVGVFSAGLNRRDTENQIVVAGIQSVYNKAEQLGSFDLIIVDEAHLIPPDGDGMYQTFLNEMKKINDNVRLIGMTATPYRLKGGLICKDENLLNEVCYEISVRELINAGYLSKLKSKNGKQKANFDNLHIRGGEFIAEEIAAAMDNEYLVRTACCEIINMSQDRKKVLIFASSVEHANHIKKEIEEKSGQECGAVFGDTSKVDRAEILDRFKGAAVPADLFGNMKPELKYLVNVGVLTTGFDAPMIDVVALMRPTNSPGLYYQMVGRGFRLSPDTGKTDCLILDYGQNIMRHGPVDMIRIEESGGKRKGAPPMRECPECQAVFLAARSSCPDCGYEFPREEMKLNHGTRAASDGILSGESSETVYEVKDTSYSVHYKRGNPEAPRTMRVDYLIGFNDFQSEWVCPEHIGYARKKAENWWKARSHEGMPDDADECVEMARAGHLREPKTITVRKTAGADWPQIVGYDLEPEPRIERGDGGEDMTPGERAAIRYGETVVQGFRDEAEKMGFIDLPDDPDEALERIAIMQEGSLIKPEVLDRSLAELERKYPEMFNPRPIWDETDAPVDKPVDKYAAMQQQYQQELTDSKIPF